MARPRKTKNDFDSSAINRGILFLFLAGCLVTAIIGGYSVMIYYTTNHTNNTPNSNEMQINTNKQQSVAEDGGTATIIK